VSSNSVTPVVATGSDAYQGAGTSSVFAGAAGVTGSANGSLSAARFNNGGDIVRVGNVLYSVDRTGNRIRKIDLATQQVSTLAGSGLSGSTDGTGTEASFSYPWGMTTDGTNLYVTDYNSSALRKVEIGTGKVTTLVSSGMTQPVGITYLDGKLYVADRTGQKIRVVNPVTGVFTTLPGTHTSLQGVTTDGTSLYISLNKAIKKVDPVTGDSTLLAGSTTTAGFADGPAADARFNNVYQMVHQGGYLYIADLSNGRVRKISTATGMTSTVAADLGGPIGLALVGGAIYVNDFTRHVVLKIS
jgi:sugar lactone lactonase YvrE